MKNRIEVIKYELRYLIPNIFALVFCVVVCFVTPLWNILVFGFAGEAFVYFWCGIAMVSYPYGGILILIQLVNWGEWREKNEA